MQREIEVKFDVPTSDVSMQNLIDILERISLNGSTYTPIEEHERIFEYFDNSHFGLHENSETIRRVTYVNPKSKKGTWRYDYKKGQSTSRLESHYFANSKLTHAELQTHLEISPMPPELCLVAVADTTHYKSVLRIGDAQIKIKMDLIKARDIGEFGELELELTKIKPANIGLLNRLIEKVNEDQRLTYTSLQKYSRIVMMMDEN